ncbi:acetyltransferase [Streptomyces sp. WMMB 322]|uniref:acetyltransferase n=1 Tax=Streptomyces sp. WMMB 322 TaxID=1286821 RepID=UPI0006E429DB|nr:acetyltransferase [Streptomyces sp. WMMB 322]
MRGAPAQPAPGVTYEQDGPLVRAVGGFRAFVFGPRDTGLRGAALDRLIARQRDRFAAREETAEWRVHAHDQPPDLSERLRAAGFVAGDSKTVLVGASAELAAGVPEPDGVVIRRVTEAGDMRRIAAMEAAVWDMDLSWLARFLTERAAAAPDGAVVLVAEAGRAGGQVVSAGWMIFQAGRGFAGLRGGTTLPEWRGRGLYRALVAERARLAAARRVPHLQVDASDDSLPILRRLGFRAVTTMTPYVWTPARS